MMLGLALFFLVLAGISGLLGFGGWALSFVSVAQKFFYIFLGFFAAALVAHLILWIIYLPKIKQRKEEAMRRLYGENYQGGRPSTSEG